MATPAEAAAIVSAKLNDTVTVCMLSCFNTFFVLQGLAAAGELDRGLAALHRCWDVQVLLGASTTWETSQPDWTSVLDPGAPIPGFEDGFTSMAHPWSSGATAWATAHLLGVQRWVLCLYDNLPYLLNWNLHSCIRGQPMFQL